MNMHFLITLAISMYISSAATSAQPVVSALYDLLHDRVPLGPEYEAVPVLREFECYMECNRDSRCQGIVFTDDGVAYTCAKYDNVSMVATLPSNSSTKTAAKREFFCRPVD